MSRYGKAITELIDRGYSIEEISQKLILGNALVVMDSAIHYIPDYKILADFIENGIDLIASDYELLSNYTSDNFDNYNDVTIDEKGNKVYGDKYMADEADALSNLLKQQSIVRDMTVYRGEGFEVLNSYVLDNGQKLGEYLQKIVETGDTEAIKELEAKLVGNTITQPRFMSTSYDQEKASEFIEQETGIMWEIDVNKGAHGLWADPFNTENSDEREILFDRDSKLVIYGIEIVDNIVVIKAKLHQD
jgi:hypothetical protein